MRTALRHLMFSPATVPLTDGYKMRCHHFGTAMKLLFRSLTVLSTHNYRPEIRTMYGCNPPIAGVSPCRLCKNTSFPTLDRETLPFDGRLILRAFAWSRPRAPWQVPSRCGCYLDREDHLASKDLCGLAAFATLFKVTESQQRGFAYGQGKVHSVPDGSKELHIFLANVVREVAKLKEASGDRHPAGEIILGVVDKESQSKNAILISSSGTRQHESETLPARQMGQEVHDAPFSEKQMVDLSRTALQKDCWYHLSAHKARERRSTEQG